MNESNMSIRRINKNNCDLCGCKGDQLYIDLSDRLFGVPGKWNIFKCTNKKCGLLWVNPVPVEEDLGLLYNNYYTHNINNTKNSLVRRLYENIKASYLSLHFGYPRVSNGLFHKYCGYLLYLHPGRRAEADSSVMYLPNMQNGKLLEIGSGSGETLYRLQLLGWSVKGVDFDPLAVEKARNQGLDVALGDVFSQKFTNDTFDAVIMSHVIEHVPDPVGLLKECYRILKPGGRIMVTTPNSSSMGHWIYRENWRGLEPPRHLNIFNIPTLECICIQAGFNTMKLKPAGWGRNILLKSLALSTVGREKFHAYQTIFKIFSGMLAMFESAITRIFPALSEQILLSAKK